MADEKNDTISYEKSVDEESNEGKEERKIKKLKDELKRCEALQKEYLDGWQRAKADFINYRKDEGKRYQDMARVIRGELVADLIRVLDSFEGALRSEMPKEAARGIGMIQTQLEDILRKHGFEYIAVKPGEMFDPTKHESIGEIESSHPSGTIAEEAQKGYLVNGRVARPARVKLAK